MRLKKYLMWMIVGFCILLSGCSTSQKGEDLEQGNRGELTITEKSMVTISPMEESKETSTSTPEPTAMNTPTPTMVIVNEYKDVWTVVVEQYTWDDLLNYALVYNGKEYGLKVTSLISDDVEEVIIREWPIESLPNVVSIGAYALAGTNVSKVVIPESIEEIGSRAFENCSNLVEIEIPKTVKYIGSNAFHNTAWLDFKKFTQDMIVVNGIVVDATTLTGDIVLSEDIVGIAGEAFAGSGITSIEIPDTVTYIGENAFAETPWLESERGKNPLVVVNGILIDGKKAKGKVEIPENVAVVADLAFSNNMEIESIVFPQRVLAIGEEAFLQCENLKFMILPENLESIGSMAFWGCSRLKAMVDRTSGEMTDKLPQTLVQLGEEAFYGCLELESMNLPENVKVIGEGLFSKCNKLKKVEFPDSLEYIGARAFQNCKSLKSIVIPEGIWVLCEYTFMGCEKLENVQLPKSLTQIRDYCFYDCDSLITIEFPENLLYIRSKALANCDGMKKLIFPDVMRTLERDAFEGCYSLEEIWFPDNAVFTFGRVVDASWYNGSSGSENSNKNLRKIRLPQNVTEIAEEAFAYTALESIELPYGLNKIQDSAFAYTALEYIEIPSSVTYIECGGYIFEQDAIFYNCKKLKEVVFSEGKGELRLYEGLFKGCDALEKVVLNEAIVYIDDKVFKGTNLKSITIPGSVKYIGDYVFEDCMQLKEVILCEGVETIGEGVFELVDGMNITFPNSVTSIGNWKREYSSSRHGYIEYYTACFIRMGRINEMLDEKIVLYCPKESYAYSRLIEGIDPKASEGYEDWTDWEKEYIVWGGEKKNE